MENKLNEVIGILSGRVYGIVYKCINKKTNKYITVKKLKKQKINYFYYYIIYYNFRVSFISVISYNIIINPKITIIIPYCYLFLSI